MIDRCRKPGARAYCDYGARGIQVCERWLVFKNFVEDMGIRPPDTTIDRINGRGHYEPGNCRWATKKTQANNVSDNHHLTYDGDTMTLAQWAEDPRCKTNYDNLKNRIRLGWSVVDAITKPTHTRGVKYRAK